MEQQNIKVAVDAVVFGYQDNELKCLLIKRNIEPFKDMWAIPGGLVLENENLEEAVLRELKEESGVEISYMEQLYSFGNVNRDPRNRVISISYFAMVKPSNFELVASTDASEARWFSINELPKLAFDHIEIIEYAKNRLRDKLKYKPIGINLLNETFTMKELQNLYESILGEEIDKRNFNRNIKNFDILNVIEVRRNDGPGRPAVIYSFDINKYQKMEKEGILFEI